ncbi:MAG: methyltransferase domain-containing protein [Myxococcales bacterium]|nr:MAG: methyltransferase domain-containing protein [Myxococcales bacterium]
MAAAQDDRVRFPQAADGSLAVHDEALEAAFGDASPEHFRWQTSAPGIAERERELVQAAFLPLGQRVLDLGCGEGATLFHLGSPAGAVGVDLFPKKVAFAQEHLPSCRFVTASVYELPFDDGAFDHVLVRDVVHHLEEPERFVQECARVLAPGGRIDVLEPCRYNPLIAMHAALNEAERGELRSTEPFLRSLLAGRFAPLEVARFQPMPLHRLVYHPTLGRPSLGHSEAFRSGLSRFEAFLGKVVPRAAWAYLHLRGRLRAAR